jgi:hypothetical protein
MAESIEGCLTVVLIRAHVAIKKLIVTASIVAVQFLDLLPSRPLGRLNALFKNHIDRESASSRGSMESRITLGSEFARNACQTIDCTVARVFWSLPPQSIRPSL